MRAGQAHRDRQTLNLAGQGPTLRRIFAATGAAYIALQISCCLSLDLPDVSAPRIRKIRSTSGAWEVFGTNDMEMAAALRWGEEAARSLERLVGPFNDEPSVGRLVLPPASVATTSAVWKVAVTNGVVVRRLDLPSADPPDLGRSLPSLCGLLLAQPGAPGRDAARFPPAWLCVGLAQNLHAANREWNAGELLRRWREGRAGTLRSAFDSVQTAAPPDPVVCGALVTWILSWEQGTQCIRAIISGLDEDGRAVSPEWLLQWRGGCGSAADLDEKWDEWILSRRTMVYQAGLVTPALVLELETEMTFCGRDGRVLRGRDLAYARSVEPWVRTAAASRSAAVRLMGAGRDAVFQEAVSAVADFLDSVADGRSSARRRGEMLRRAEEAVEAARRRAEELWPELPADSGMEGPP